MDKRIIEWNNEKQINEQKKKKGINKKKLILVHTCWNNIKNN